MVTDSRGIEFHRKVWKDAGSVIFITSKAVYKALDKGDFKIWPIGVPRGTVTISRKSES